MVKCEIISPLFENLRSSLLFFCTRYGKALNEKPQKGPFPRSGGGSLVNTYDNKARDLYVRRIKMSTFSSGGMRVLCVSSSRTANNAI